MSVSRLPFLFLFLPILFAAAPQPKHDDPFTHPYVDDAPSFELVPCELRAVANSIGIDYFQIILPAAKGDINSIRQLLRFTTTHALNDPDAISQTAAYSHDVVLSQLLRHIGDAKFAQALSQESPKMRTAILADLNWSPTYLARWYPRTAAAFAPIPPPTLTSASSPKSHRTP